MTLPTNLPSSANECKMDPSTVTAPFWICVTACLYLAGRRHEHCDTPNDQDKPLSSSWTLIPHVSSREIDDAALLCGSIWRRTPGQMDGWRERAGLSWHHILKTSIDVIPSSTQQRTHWHWIWDMTKWCKVMQNGARWSDTKWCKVMEGNARCHKVMQGDTKWNKVMKGDAKWCKVMRCETVPPRQKS